MYPRRLRSRSTVTGAMKLVVMPSAVSAAAALKIPCSTLPDSESGQIAGAREHWCRTGLGERAGHRRGHGCILTVVDDGIDVIRTRRQIHAKPGNEKLYELPTCRSSREIALYGMVAIKLPPVVLSVVL